jgi:hypothetical protein
MFARYDMNISMGSGADTNVISMSTARDVRQGELDWNYAHLHNLWLLLEVRMKMSIALS